MHKEMKEESKAKQSNKIVCVTLDVEMMTFFSLACSFVLYVKSNRVNAFVNVCVRTNTCAGMCLCGCERVHE